MAVEYVKHDGIVLRRETGDVTIEAFIGGKWKPFPEGKEPGQFAIAAWAEGTILSAKEAESEIKAN